jgi:hypothetical protein
MLNFKKILYFGLAVVFLIPFCLYCPEFKDSGNTPLLLDVSPQGVGINLLREVGANTHAANNNGVSPVSLARTIANYNVAQFFSDLP